MGVESKLSRRDFLKLGGLAATALAIPIGCNSDSLQKQIEQRQKIIDQIVQEESSPYVGRVYYDHDGSLKRKAAYDEFIRSLNDPQHLAYILKYSEGAEKFGLTQEDFRTLSKLPDFLKYILFRIRYKADDVYASTVLYPSDFGKGIKSDIYVFGDTFKKLVAETKQRVIEIPNEEKIRAILKHEFTHAKDNYKGINLGEGLVIDASNIFDINPRVKRFVGEVEAHLKEVEFSRQFGREHPVYWWALGQLFSNVSHYYNKHIKDRKFTPYEKRLIDYQLDKLDKIRPEAMQIFEKLR